MEDLRREVGHVAVEEDEEGLDDTGVGGEARGEGTEEAVNGSEQDSSQRNHEETDDTEESIDHRDCSCVGELLEEMIQHLHRDGDLRATYGIPPCMVN